MSFESLEPPVEKFVGKLEPTRNEWVLDPQRAVPSLPVVPFRFTQFGGFAQVPTSGAVLVADTAGIPLSWKMLAGATNVAAITAPAKTLSKATVTTPESG